MHIEIVHEDTQIVVVNKPNDILIHNSYYARNIKEVTLLELLEKQLGYKVYPIHRLDRKTSGILVLAKEKTYVADFQSLFDSQEIQKTYMGIVRGHVKDSLNIDTPVKHPETKIYKEAETFCTPLLSSEINIPVHPYETSRYTLVELKPKTGRIHQLRIHMNKISHPIVGDSKYGDRFHNRMFESEFKSNSLYLHAYAIEFKHPKTNLYLNFKAELPGKWEEVFQKFQWDITNNKSSSRRSITQ